MALDVAFKFKPVTPSDTLNLPDGAAAAGLYIGSAGNLSFNPFDPALPGGVGPLVVALPVPVGRFAVCVARVQATGTTATNIAALY